MKPPIGICLEKTELILANVCDSWCEIPLSGGEKRQSGSLPLLSEEAMSQVRELYERLVRPHVHHYWNNEFNISVSHIAL
jgi:hypothetical protein